MRSASVACVLLGLAAAVARAETIETTFQDTDEVAGRRLLVTKAGTYQLPEAVFVRSERLFLFLEPGDAITVEVERGSVVSLARSTGGASEGPASSPIDEAVAGCERGDLVEIDGRPHRFLGADERYVIASPQVPGSDEFAGESRFARERIREFVVLERAVESAPLPDDDPFEVLKVAAGDTVEVAMRDGAVRRGIVLELTNAACRLRSWLGAGLGAEHELARREVREVRRAALEGVEEVDLGEGVTLFLHLRRFAEKGRSRGGITVEAEHDSEAYVVAGVRVVVRGEPVAADLDPMAPGDVQEGYLATFAVGGEVAVDAARLELIGIGDERARPHLLAQLEAAEGAEDPTAIYRAAAAAGSQDLLHYVVSIAAGTGGVTPAQTRGARAALLALGEPGFDAVAHELRANRARLDRTVLAGGALRLEPVPPDERSDHLAALVEVLDRLPGDLTEGQARGVIAQAGDPAVRPAVAALVASRSGEVVGALLERARERGAGSVAAELLDSVDRDVLATSLRFAGVPEEACETLPGPGEPGAGARALELIALAGIDEEVASLEARAAEGALEEALTGLDDLLARDPDHAEARALRADVVSKLARSHLDAGRRGDAAILLEELAGDVEAARRPLARAYMDGLREALSGTPVRAQPHPGGDTLKSLPKGQPVRGEEVRNRPGWVAVKVASGTGYAAVAALDPAGEGKYRSAGGVPDREVEARLARIRELDPGLSAEADQVVGILLLNEAEAAYEAADYGTVLSLIEEARDKASPGDPRFDLETLAWWHANAPLLGLGATALVFVAGVTIYFRSRRVPRVVLPSPEEREAAKKEAAKSGGSSASASHRKTARARGGRGAAASGGSKAELVKKLALGAIAASLAGVILWQLWKVVVAFS